MRTILINWIIETVKDFTFRKLPRSFRDDYIEIAFMAIMITDKFLEKKVIIRKKFQLLGTSALNLAFKYETGYYMAASKCSSYCADAYEENEVSFFFLFFLQNKLTNKILYSFQFISMEQNILENLNYSLMFPTTHTFLSIYLYIDNSPESVKTSATEMIVKIIGVYDMLKYKPSIIAASVIYFAKKLLSKAPYWSLNLSGFTTYKVRDLIKCIDDIKKLT